MSVCGLRERERDLQDMIWSALLCMFFGRNVYPSQQIDCHSFSVCWDWDVISITSDELYNEIYSNELVNLGTLFTSTSFSSL